jgi:hypothetical protein
MLFEWLADKFWLFANKFQTILSDYEVASTCSTENISSMEDNFIGHLPLKRNFLFFYFFEHIYCRQLKKSKKWTCELFLWERILNLAFQMRSNKQNWILPDSIACFYEWKQDPKTDGFKLKTIWLKGIYEQNLALLKQVDCNENELRSQFVSQRKPINVITTDNVIKLKEIFRSQLSY